MFVAEPAKQRSRCSSAKAAGAPQIDGVYAQSLTPSSERLSAQIDPHGADTSYYFQYGTVSCVAEPSACSDVPVAPGGQSASGFGDQLASVELEGLAAEHDLLLPRARDATRTGRVESPQSTQTFFTTLPSAEGVLADHRQWELVSPPEKHGATVEPISREGALIQASADGDAIAWTASAPVSGEAQGNRRPEPVQVISTRRQRGMVLAGHHHPAQ